MQNPYAAANTAILECSDGLAELLSEFDAGRKARRNARPPAAVSGNPRSVTAPVGPMQQGGTRLSNLDMNGRLVKRGVMVSYHGLRFSVVKVNRGFFWGRRVSTGIYAPVGNERLLCESVQVVGKAAPPVSRVGATGAALPLCN